MSDALARITMLAETLKQARVKQAAADDRAREAKAECDKIETEDLPELFKELDLSVVVLGDGRKIEVLEDLKCSISETNRPDAHNWLRENKLGGIIKNTLELSYGVDEEDRADDDYAKIVKITNRPVDKFESVHAGTLKATLKEVREAGKLNVPAALFGLFPYNKVKITEPKASKKKS